MMAEWKSDLGSMPLIDDVNWRGFSKPMKADGASVTGYIPRDLRVYPKGFYGAVPPFPKELLIPRSEWPRMIEAMEKSGTRLSDVIRAADAAGTTKWLNQDPTNYSHDGNTEVLTDRGFVKWSDYNWTDLLATVNQLTGGMEFQAPTEGHAYEYDDEMYHSTNKRLDFGVTRNHRMYVRKWDERRRTLSNEYSFQRADELGWYVGLMHAPYDWIGTELVEVEIPGDRRYDGDDFAAMLSLIVSDGYAGGSESTRDLVSFCCFVDDRYPKIAALAQRIGFKEQPSRRGVWNRHNAPALAEWVRQNCYHSGQPFRSPHKVIPGIIKHMSRRQIGVFLNFFGDQSHSRDYNRSMFSSSKRVVDDLQELLLRVGKRGTIWKPQNYAPAQVSGGNLIEPNGPIYSVGISDTDRLCLDRKKHIETDHYKGLVYCATVPNGTLVTRRNGSILISGNCWCYAVTHACMIIRLWNNQPFVRLSPYSAAAIIKNYQNNGGWGTEAVQFIVSNGIASEEFWPQGKLDGSNGSANMNAIRNGRQYLDGSRANAALHKLDGVWYDCSGSFDEKMSMLLRRTPVPSGYDWQGHETCSIDPVYLGNNKFGCVDMDSYTEDGKLDAYARTESKGTGSDQSGLFVIAASDK